MCCYKSINWIDRMTNEEVFTKSFRKKTVLENNYMEKAKRTNESYSKGLYDWCRGRDGPGKKPQRESTVTVHKPDYRMCSSVRVGERRGRTWTWRWPKKILRLRNCEGKSIFFFSIRTLDGHEPGRKYSRATRSLISMPFVVFCPSRKKSFRQMQCTFCTIVRTVIWLHVNIAYTLCVWINF